MAIKNFRSFKDFECEFQPGLNVIVGRNNTGKTNLLHAIRQAIGPAASRGDSLWLDRDDFHRPSSDKPHADEFSITLTFSDLSDEQRSFFFEMVEFDLADLKKSRATLRMKATWSPKRKQVLVSRTGGASVVDAPELSQLLLGALSITFLPALRDAEASLAPGQRSRLAQLLSDRAGRRKKGDEEKIVAIVKKANDDVVAQDLIAETKEGLLRTTGDLARSDYAASTISTMSIEFERILRTLRVQMDGAAVADLDANGLGYNNLLYMAVILEHLKDTDPDSCPLFLVEEPEAHLHPQLAELLARYLGETRPGTGSPQTFVTTHSPTIAASVSPKQVQVVFTDGTGAARCNSVAGAGMNEKELLAFQRMMDVTRATLYFAKGAVLVEGISEALLLPVLADRLGPAFNLKDNHVSVIPIAGVAFETFVKLLKPEVFDIPVAIITDADPPVKNRKQDWEKHEPEKDGVNFKVCDRTKQLVQAFAGQPSVKVVHSKVTLEYDLAEAGEHNAAEMAKAWDDCYTKDPQTFSASHLTATGMDREAKALAAWRGICRSSATAGKGEFSHRLSAHLAQKDATGVLPAFVVPRYLEEAIKFVVDKVKPPAPLPTVLAAPAPPPLVLAAVPPAPTPAAAQAAATGDGT